MAPVLGDVTRALREASAAAAANTCVALASHPLHIAKLRTQAREEARNSNKAVAETSLMEQLLLLYRGGLGEMYRGIGAETVKTAVSSFNFFFLRSYFIARLAQFQSWSPLTRSLVAGVLAAATNQLCWESPATVVTTKIVTSRKNATDATIQGRDARLGALDTLRGVIRRGQLYDGIEASLWLTAMPALTNALLDELKRRWLRRGRRRTDSADRVSALASFILSAVAKSSCTVILYPLIRAKVLLQKADAQRERRALYGSQVAAILARSWRESGARGLYVGLSAQITKATIASAFKLAVKDEIAAAFGV